jgi:hypothetical protein
MGAVGSMGQHVVRRVVRKRDQRKRLTFRVLVLAPHDLYRRLGMQQSRRTRVAQNAQNGGSERN